MTKKDFIVNEKELSAFIRLNNIYEKFIAKTNTGDMIFVSETNKQLLISDYIKKISKEKIDIAKNDPNVRIGSKINFWALNKNYEEITSGVVEERDIAFTEILKE